MRALADRAAALLGGSVAGVRRLSGGDLSMVLHVDLADGRAMIVKEGATARAEADMLNAIAATGAPAPAVLGVANDMLLLEELAAWGGLDGGAWADLARALGMLHAGSAGRYGWASDHCFGPVAIPNGWRDDWPGFWAENRLLCHVGHVPRALGRRIERLADGLADRLPARPPAALLHGDLWGGNILVAQGRVTGLVDPACYHGDREVDVAMLTLFDHPGPRFFDALALSSGWRDRLPVYRLWPLLVHLRLFGSGYAAAVSDALAAAGA